MIPGSVKYALIELNLTGYTKYDGRARGVPVV